MGYVKGIRWLPMCKTSTLAVFKSFALMAGLRSGWGFHWWIHHERLSTVLPTMQSRSVANQTENWGRGVSCKWKQLPSPLLAGFPWIRVPKFFHFVDFSTLSRTRKVQSWGFAFEKINRHEKECNLFAAQRRKEGNEERRTEEREDGRMEGRTQRICVHMHVPFQLSAKSARIT